MVYEFDRTKHGKLRDMRAARRAKPPDPVRGGTDFTRAAHAVGVPKRTGKAWRNGMTRSTGRNERPLSDRCRGSMDKPKRIDAGHLRMDGRIAIARTPGRTPSTISRGPRRNAADIGGVYGPHRARQMATHRPRRPKPRKIMPGTRLRDETEAGLDKHWSPEQTGGRLRRGHPDNGSMNACHETIHQAIYVQGKGEPRPQLKHAMRRGRTARRHRGDGQSRRPRSREPMAMTGDRPAEATDRAAPGHREGDLDLRRRQPQRDRHPRGTHHPVHDPPAPARRTRHRTRAGRHHRQDAATARAAAQQPGMGPGTRTRPAYTRVRRARHAGALPRPPQPPAARHQREHQRLAAPALPNGTDPSGYTEEHLDAIATEPDDRPRKTPDHTKPNEKTPEPTDDTATPTPTDTNNTNCQQRRCNDH